MRKEDFFEVLGELDDDIVKGAESAGRGNKVKRRIWAKWGAAAACLCLAAVGAVVFLQQNSLYPGSVDEGGGTYSVAVYPAHEREENVELAEVVSLTEGEASGTPLGEYLPRQLPQGFHYGRGSMYHTVMKDGKRYTMLRVEYISGIIPEQQYTEDGGAVAPDLDTTGELFIICILNFEPDTDGNIYSHNKEVTVSLLEEKGAVYYRSGDCYIGVFPETAEPAAVFEALKSMK